MSVTVEAMCDALLLSGLMPPDDVSALRTRWFRPERTGAQDVDKFAKWLVMNQFLTELQASMLLKGQADNLYLHQYRILDRIGKGRMAGIYKALDGQGQTVALKVLPPSKAKDPEALIRFQREARLAMQLDHPNVVRTLDAGEANGKHYIVMEYMEGSTLSEVLERKGKLDPVEAARIIAHALNGLQHIHEKQMVHRDLEPANLMLTANPAGGGKGHRIVKILDIGLGRALFDEGALVPENGGLTMKGTLLGTLDYMSPEQARDAHSADIRSDIYSLGCVLYHCLTGEPPNRNVNMLQRYNQPPRPVKEFNPNIPDTLQQIVEQMLAFDPKQRYQTPAGAARAIRIFLNAESQSTEPDETDVQPEFNEARAAPAAAPAHVAAPMHTAAANPALGNLSNEKIAEAVWDQIKPSDRDILVFFVGIVLVLIIEAVFALLLRHGVREFILITLGVGLGLFLEKYLQRRREQAM